MMIKVATIDVHTFVTVVSLLSAITAAQERLICPNLCGNVAIPYPFGVEGCNLSPEFLITCNDTTNPPQPFLRKSNIKITNITLEGQLEIVSFAGRDCYDQLGNRQAGFRRRMLTLSNFTISKSQNKFTVIGCDSYAYLQGYRYGKLYTSGCLSVCDEREFVDNKSCSGSGCCQIEIPDGLNRANVTAYSFNNHTNVSDFNPCTYAFIVEESKFNFSFEYLQNIIADNTEFPMVLDWAIDNRTSEEHNHACKDHAYSYQPPNNISGYRCECKKGYQGNPYLGCQDIDECEDENMNNCIHKDNCINSDGGYSCKCHKGYRGDGRKDGEGCNPINDQFLFIKIIFGIGISFIGLFVGSSWLYLVLKQRKLIKLKAEFFEKNGGLMLQQKLCRQEGASDTAKIFTAEELKKATNNYDKSTIVGKGGFGIVYKGILADNREVAIKKSIQVDQSQIEQFINEVVVLSQINHRNVVRLLGCCLETEVPLLVYEFIANGALFKHIHDENKASALSWDIRLRIAVETAGALSYLHSEASVPIIHRDVKTDNILLDANYTAKVSDFGASRLVPLNEMQLSTIVKGTCGYLDPEYMQTSQLTEKSDVYSFGVVIVELLTCEKALCFQRPEELRSLAMYFLSSMKVGNLFEILDNRIVNEENKEKLEAMAQLAKRCLSVKGEERPSMREVAIELEGLQLKDTHPWVEENSEETEYLLKEQFVADVHADGLTSSSISGHDSIKNHVILSVGDGR